MSAALLLLPPLGELSVAAPEVPSAFLDRLRRVNRTDEYLRRATENEEDATNSAAVAGTGSPHYLLLFFGGASVQELSPPQIRFRLRRVNVEETGLRRVTDTEGARPQTGHLGIMTFACDTFAARTFRSRSWRGPGADI